MTKNIQKIMKSALLLTDSHLWGIWCYRALKRVGLFFEPVLAEELSEEYLGSFKALFVPGGWSRNKLESLGDEGKRVIRAFVENGGIYIGICGGASLAGLDGLSISPVRRKKERVPSYSGPCRVKFLSKEALLKGIAQPIFYLWFPPEIEIVDGNAQNSADIIAIFEAPLKEAYTSDLCLEDHECDLAHIEKLYNLPLDPNRMQAKPLIFESPFGKGKVFISLIHFDTPNCPAGLMFLKNLAELYELPKQTYSEPKIFSLPQRSISLIEKAVSHMKQMVDSLLEFGMRNFLFHRRYPFFIQWKRGIRGLELLNLQYAFEELESLICSGRASSETLQRVGEQILELEEDLRQVLETLKKSYILKRFNIDDPLYSEEERRIFGENLKSYGGLYRELINKLERILCYLWREERC